MRDDEFERLYAAEAAGLFSFLAYRTGDRALAEDLLADAFERALRARGRFDRRRGSQKTWLYAIALNCLRDHARRASAEARALERAGMGPARPEIDPLASVERRDELGRALTALSADEREAIALRFGADLTVPEIAKVLGEPLTTVEGRVYRALRKLRSELS
jgi:RNA polymerase sigma factor (sigma-70 family)